MFFSHWFASPRFKVAVQFILLTLVFSVAYTQSPLFTSNQNQYYLHGLAAAGYGHLNQDWLAGTVDPTPVFSALIAWTYRLFGTVAITYGYQMALLGLYAWCMLGIVTQVVAFRRSWADTVLFLGLMTLVHSAGLRFALSRAVDINWTYVLEDGLADQRLLGPVFQPSMFGVLLVVSLYVFLRGRPALAAGLAALAAVFHPTYLLSAATLTAAYMLCQFLPLPREQWLTWSAWRTPVRVGLAALVVVAPILIYVATQFGVTPAETTARARQILVHYRIPHHALVSWWLDGTAVVKFLLLGAGIWIARRSRLFPVLLACLLVAGGLTLVQVATGSNALALIFPWRLSVFLVPLCTCLILAWAVMHWPALRPGGGWLVGRALLGGIVIALCVVVGGIRLKLDFERQAYAPENPMLAYVAAHPQTRAIYLTPIKLETFRLAAGAPVYVDFKAIPYRDSDVLEWYQRVQLADRFYKHQDCSILQAWAQAGAVTHVILPSEAGWTCPGLQALYQDGAYGVYSVSSTP